MSSGYQRIYLVVLYTLLLTACVSTKKFDVQKNRLDITTEQLSHSVSEQQNLKLRVQKLSDSLVVLEKQHRENQVQAEYKLFKLAQQTGDKQLAATSLTRLVLLDSTQGDWAYDSLALYHYLYLITPGMPRHSQSAMYFTQKGLQLNPENAFLLETQAKLNLELQKDSLAFKTFKALWDKHGDYTYLFEMTYMDLYIFENVKRVETVINEVVKSKESEVRKVRIELIDDHLIQQIPAKAAFLYLRAILQNAQGQQVKSRKTLEEVVKIAPEYLSAQRALYQMKNPQYR